MSTTQRKVEATLITADGREVNASLSCVIHVPDMGLRSWFGMGWAGQDIMPGDCQVRDSGGNEARIFITKATAHFNDQNGPYTTIEFRGNGEIPAGWLP